MSSFMLSIRERYHPLFHLRKFKAFQYLTQLLDIPLAYKMTDLPHRIYLSFSKNLSFILAGKFTELQEKENFKMIVKFGGFTNYFDVGANIGYYGFLFKALVPSGKVVLVEPDSTNLNLLRKTISKYAPDVILVEAAASDVVGTIDFFVDEVSGSTGSIDLSDNFFVAKHHNIVPKKITVKATTIDQMALKYGTPDFIKIDVESAELTVLNGALNVIVKDNPAVFFECDSEDARVSEIFIENNYSLFEFNSLRRTSSLNHNNLALHNVKHAKMIDLLENMQKL